MERSIKYKRIFRRLSIKLLYAFFLEMETNEEVVYSGRSLSSLLDPEDGNSTIHRNIRNAHSRKQRLFHSTCKGTHSSLRHGLLRHSYTWTQVCEEASGVTDEAADILNPNLGWRQSASLSSPFVLLQVTESSPCTSTALPIGLNWLNVPISTFNNV